jgi:hypothetical protein
MHRPRYGTGVNQRWRVSERGNEIKIKEEHMAYNVNN